MPQEDGAEPSDTGSSVRGALIILLYVRPACDGPTELDRRVGAIAERYAAWVELIVIRPEEVAGSGFLRERGEAWGMGSAIGSGASCPALLLLRGGEVVGEAMGALLPSRELDHVVRCAVEWPAPA
jgi:hypothetical protein